jgi:uncharacterized membrane protein YhhN
LATLLEPSWFTIHSTLAFSGAGLFFLSDFLIAWHRYHSTVKARDLKVMVTYHLGQAGIILAVVLHFRG